MGIRQLTGLVVLAFSILSLQLSEQLTDVATCLNKNQPNAEPTSWEGCLSGARSQFSILGVWSSSNESQLSGIGPLTLVTTLQGDQVEQLKGLCKSWLGPLSAVIHAFSVTSSQSPDFEKQAQVTSASNILNETLHEDYRREPEHIEDTRGEIVNDGYVTEADGFQASNRTRQEESDSTLRSTNSETIGHKARRLESLQTSADDAVTMAKALFEELKRLGGCQVDLLLVHEKYVSERALSMYPGALLKNYGRLLARTPFLAFVDVDLVVSSGLWRNRQRLHTSRPPLDSKPVAASKWRAAWVLPTFYVSGSSRKQEQAVSEHLASVGTREKILGALKSAKEVQQAAGDDDDADRNHASAKPLVVRMDKLLASHLPTQYERWLEVQEPYRIIPDELYDPVVIVSRVAAPWCDIRFRGYLRGHAAWVESLSVQGFVLGTDPRSDAFAVHRSHLPSKTQSLYSEEQNLEAERRLSLEKLRGRMKDDSDETWSLESEGLKSVAGTWQRTRTLIGYDTYLQAQVTGLQEQKVYFPHVDNAVLNCMNVLPWWGSSVLNTTKKFVHRSGKSFSTTEWYTPESELWDEIVGK
ncbi:hypothetical protein CEUSTIGMA_g12821.t1 [Chlamydomonas eustigma]|uniref:Uncharacterized protein n=1 Tax=Chlamydomonas eustigma TaxID=1157962 RepID=A0A250XQS0_9CHLO|nr:hypothetical protein CEUSTIGMA_g12821.t1 [Chlamydomonas eustigma]|eukprot:GAX85405.1 hypothetical protein CEUSTIGMA_g12821.t1 [Chlamydomonas eustigma]